MKYNTKKEGTPTVTTHQGGVAYQQSAEIALLSLLATGMDKTYYEGSSEREQRLVHLVQAVAKKDKYFVAQCIVYARAILGQRTITHRAAVELAKHISGEEWAKRFFGRWDKKKGQGGVIFRVDDMLEIASCYFHFNQNTSKKRGVNPLSNAMRAGFRSAFDTMDEFEMARYQGKGKTLKLVDLMRLVHPIPNEINKEALLKLMNGELKQFNTSEAKNSEAGQEVAKLVREGKIDASKAEEVLQEKKANNFRELIESGTIGYTQLLRNLYNIAIADQTLIDIAGELLTNKGKIIASKVYPHQIDLALEVVREKLGGTISRKLVSYVDQAYELSTTNVYELGIDEATAVFIDTSGSMHGTRVIPMGNRTPIEKAALIGATLAKGVQADIYQFASWAQELKYNPKDSINTIKGQFMSHQGECDNGTMMEECWKLLNRTKKHYKRVFIISDMQIADSMCTKGSEYKEFCKRNEFGTPYIYAIDVCGYGTQPLKANGHYFNIVGYSAQIYETAKNYEVDPQALINEVKMIKI